MSELSGAAQFVELLLFEVGDAVYAADATQVRRIDRMATGAAAASALGPLREGKRALVFSGPQGETSLAVDRVRGVRRAAVGDLRRRPGPAAGDSCAIGFWLDAGNPVVLIDLARTLHSHGRQ